MSTELQEALARAADDAKASFEARDAMEVIAPTARRVRRHRARVTAAAAVGSVAVLTGMLWGADAMAGVRALQPAGTGGSIATPVPTGEAGEPAWTTTNLAATATPRKPGEVRDKYVAGMICRHESPEDDPRVAVQQMEIPAVSHASTAEDCTPVWFKRGPSTDDGITSISFGAPSEGIEAQIWVTNTSMWPLEIDRDSVFIWIESAPGEVPDSEAVDSEAPDSEFTAYNHALVGASMWDAYGSNLALLDSSTQSVVIAPGEEYHVAIQATDPNADSTLNRLLAAGEPVVVSFWARIHEEGAHGNTTYLIQLGRATEFEPTTQ